MNQKYTMYALSLMLLITSNVSFSMHNIYKVIFRGVQLGSAGYCINKGAEEASKLNKMRNESISHLDSIPEDWIIHEFVDSELQRLNISKKQLSFGSWECVDDIICIPPAYCYNLERNQYLKQQLHESLEERAQIEKDKELTWFASLFSTRPRYTRYAIDCLDRNIDRYQNELMIGEKERAYGKFVLRHEIAHSINQDCRARDKALFLMPILVQAVCSSITYGVNKFFKIKLPTSMQSMAFRSSLAIGSIPLKIACSYFGVKFYNRYQEHRADTYACKNANSREELQTRYEILQQDKKYVEEYLFSDPDHLFLRNAQGFFKDNRSLTDIISRRIKNLNSSSNNKDNKNSDCLNDEKKSLMKIAHFMYDPDHPYFDTRIALVQKYIHKWDKDHQEHSVDGFKIL